jgi:hypothetical protein
MADTNSGLPAAVFKLPTELLSQVFEHLVVDSGDLPLFPPLRSKRNQKGQIVKIERYYGPSFHTFYIYTNGCRFSFTAAHIAIVRWVSRVFRTVCTRMRFWLELPSFSHLFPGATSLNDEWRIYKVFLADEDFARRLGDKPRWRFDTKLLEITQAFVPNFSQKVRELHLDGIQDREDMLESLERCTVLEKLAISGDYCFELDSIAQHCPHLSELAIHMGDHGFTGSLEDHKTIRKLVVSLDDRWGTSWDGW